MNRNPTQPPAWARKFFTIFCNEHLSDAVMGDLLELYERRLKTMTKRKAHLLFIWNVIQFIQPFAIRKRTRYSPPNQIDMLRNYLTVAWRVIARQRMYSAIKMGGFALGIATCMIIALYIRHELRYDAWYPDKDRLYRLYNEYLLDNAKWSSFPAPFADIVQDEFPEVEQVGRLIPYNWYNAGGNLFRRDDHIENTYEEGFAYADPELLKILSIPMIMGNRVSALSKPRSMVISQRIAQKYFPGEDPVGRVVVLNDKDTIPYTIGGVMDDIREVSHLNFDFLITLSGVEFWPGEQSSWCCWNYNVYVKLQPGTDPADFEKKLSFVRDNHYLAYLNEQKDPSAGDLKNYLFRLQPVEDVYLKSEGIHSNVRYGDIRYIRLLGGIAVFILLLACINFINLATARSANRAKEVGLRKVVGSVRGYLVRQFLTESILFSFLSFLLAILIVLATLPYFNRMIGATLAIPWSAWWFLPLMLASSVIVGIFAGLYPSVYLSAFKPIDVLKGSISRGARSSVLRGTLVVFQFTVSVVLLIGTFVIHRQMNFILNTKIGFDKEQVVMIEGVNTMKNQQAFKDELSSLAGVEHVTIGSYLPVEGTKRDMNGFWQEGKSEVDVSIGAQRWYVDEDYLDALGIKLLEGRNFDPTVASDSQAIIVNQAMAKALNLSNPVGSRIENWETWNVIGLVEDFHFESMKGTIDPLSLVYGTWGDIVCVKVNTSDMQQMVTNFTGVWDQFMPHQPIRYSFLDESYARMYADVERVGRIFTVFAVLAIVVACLGLFALSAFMVEQRGKEISIRLVLGASVGNIFRLLTQNFVMLVLIALVIGVPVGWYAMNWWLEAYEYRITIGWDVFAIAGSMAVLIAVLTVCYQSLKVATSNPVERLRSD